MPAAFISNPIEADNRLEELGWTREELLEVAAAMVSGRRSCTENDPTPAPGWMAWKEGTRRFREIAGPKGLLREEIDQVPCVVDPKRHIRFSVSNTDDGTAIEKRIPQNRNRKGPATDHAISGNQRGLFDDIPDQVVPLSRVKPQPGIIVAWFLCVYCEGEDVRAELSCPIEIEGGFITDYFERIVLVGPEDDEAVRARRDTPDESSEYDIPVSRR